MVDMRQLDDVLFHETDHKPRSDIQYGGIGQNRGMNAHVYEARLRKDDRGVDLISDALPFGRLWYGEPDAISNAIGYAKFLSRLRDAVIRVYDAAGNVIETHEHAGEFKQPWIPAACIVRAF